MMDDGPVPSRDGQDSDTGGTSGTAKIYPLISDDGNRRVLESWLEDHEAYTAVDVESFEIEADFDLVIVDEAALRAHERTLREAKDAWRPILLPVLLLLPEPSSAVIETDRSEIADNVVMANIDEVVSLPIRQTELDWRLQSLLRLQEATLESHRRTEELRRYEKALDSTGHAVYITDPDGEIVYVNEAFEELTGYARDEALGEDPRMLQSGEMSDAYYEDLWATIRSGEVWSEEIVDQRKDGTRYVASQTIAPVLEDGEVEAYVAVQEDVTERKERESVLERRTRAIEAAPVGITITDPDQDDNPLIYVNDEFEAMTGYSSEEALGRNCRFLQGEDTDPDHVARIREAIEAQEPVSQEIRNYRADGTEFWNRLEIAPVRNEAGEVVNYIGFQQDVTDRKERKATLKRQADLFAKVQDIAKVGAWEYDVRSGEATFSEQLRRLHDLDPADTPTPESSLAHYHPDDREQVRQAFERALEEGESYDIEARFRGPEGDQRWVRTQGEPQYVDGELRRVRGALQDITDLKRRQTQLTVLDRVLRHNLRNAMNVVKGLATTIQSETSGSVESSAERIVEKSDELLSLSDKQRQITSVLKEKPERTELDVGDLVATAVSTVSAASPAASLELETTGDLTAVASPEVETAILELLDNAIKHAESSSPAVRIEVARRGAHVVVTIADAGPEIPEMERKLLTEDAERSPLYHGEGLGLWLVTLIVTRSGGTVDIESGDDEGNTIHVELPAADP